MKPSPSNRTIVGAGLIALDAVESQTGSYKLFAAGSCPNVLTILQTLGWNSFPAGRIGRDPAAEFILRDFELWNVSTKYILRDARTVTPIYIQTNRPDRHVFSSLCPFCGAGFSRFSPLEEAEFKTLGAPLPEQADVFYLERVFELGVKWVREYKDRNAFVYFEPNRIDDPALFAQIAAHSNVVKYSHERRGAIHDITDALPIPLEIETFGKEGLRFRMTQNGVRSPWRAVPSLPVSHFVDSCGSGDWLSAHFLNRLRADRGRRDLDPDAVSSLLHECQRPSVQNCAFEGARGLLYRDEKPIQTGNGFCPHCGGAGTTA